MTNNTPPQSADSWKQKIEGAIGMVTENGSLSGAAYNSIIETVAQEIETAKQEGRIEMWKEIRMKILPKAEKFIKKVETGKARSKETYADMLEIRKMFDFLQELDKEAQPDVAAALVDKEV